MMAAYFPTVLLMLKETRASVILRWKAKKLRKERGDLDGGRYTARSEVEKVKFYVALQASLLRPLSESFLLIFFWKGWAADVDAFQMGKTRISVLTQLAFLVTEPIVIFFSTWISLGVREFLY